ncbi:alkaline phosphatase family protein [Pseudolysinimonas sp.]|uniref:alkaline phosphatase family protein n=1 Tax=Pseudolysinimonas sp. TaxID=2680009 RepID=UPI003F806ED0
MTSRALLIGIDGVRLDTLREVPTPRLDDLAESGFLTPARVPDTNRVMSGAMWATIPTGVGADRHGVRYNWWPSRRLCAHPDVLQRIGRTGDDVFAAVSWPPLAARSGCGPILRTPAYLPRRRPTTLPSWERADAAVVAHAISRLADPGIRAGFVYLGQADIAAHVHGVGSAYRSAIAACDALVGDLVDAVRSRPDADEWTVLVTTDHGHRDAGGHGTRTDAETAVWAIGDRRLPGWDALAPTGIADYLLAATA